MDAPTLDRMVTDLLLMDTSDGLDRVASELSDIAKIESAGRLEGKSMTMILAPK